MTTGQLDIRNCQDSGFGVLSILAEDTIAKTLAMEIPIVL